MERVKKGEKYWCINLSMGVIEIFPYVDNYYPCDNRAYEIGNYYPDKDDAELVAKKFRAVLKGADVIEVPSEEDLEKMLPDADYNDELASGACIGWRDCFRWVKSKIVK